MREVTYTASIYVGTREGYDGPTRLLDLARQFLRGYVNEAGLCVTLTRTEFIYTNGAEPGFVVGLINYPRFPSTPGAVRATALTIAGELRKLYRQQRVSVVFPDETVTLEDA